MIRAEKIRPGFLAGLLVIHLVAALWIFAGLQARQAAPFKIYGGAGHFSAYDGLRLPDFVLQDSAGRPVRGADFRGRPWVIHFIYTRCPAQCPMVTTKVEALQSLLPVSVGLATFSVDAAHDTPAAMAEFASRFRAQGSRWLFLTGAQDQIQSILKSVGAPVGVAADAHSLRLYLIDAEGRVTGLYDTSEPASLSRLREDAKELTSKPAT